MLISNGGFNKSTLPHTGIVAGVYIINASFNTTRRTIAGFVAMLWLWKGFGFSGGWTVNDQNDLLARLFGLKKVNRALRSARTGVILTSLKVSDRPEETEVDIKLQKGNVQEKGVRKHRFLRHAEDRQEILEEAFRTSKRRLG
jgi:hypothetical protein